MTTNSSTENEFTYYPSTTSTNEKPISFIQTSDPSPDTVKETSTSKTTINNKEFIVIPPPENPIDTIEPTSKTYREELQEIESERIKKKELKKKTIPAVKEEPTQPEGETNVPLSKPQESDHRFKYKQVILVRTDLNLSPGKLAAQVAHASVNAFNATPPLTRKIILQVADEAALIHFHTHAAQANLPTALITDFGLTELAPNTITTLAIGPALNEAVDPLTAQLKLL